MRSILFLMFISCFSVRASADCQALREDIDNQNWRLTGLEERMGPIRAAMANEEGPLNTTLIPLQTKANRLMAVYAADAALKDDILKALNSSITLFEETLLKRQMSKKQAQGLKAAIQQQPAVSLAQQMSELRARVHLSVDDDATLNDLANAVRALERATGDWKASEQEIVQKFLSEDHSLVDSLYDQLKNKRDRITTAIKNMKDAREIDQRDADAANKNVADAQARQNQRQIELNNLNAMHEGCAAQRAADEQALGTCGGPKLLPRPREYN